MENKEVVNLEVAHFINVPKPYVGDDAEANRASHRWSSGRCTECSARMSSVSMDYPCGAEVPRTIAIAFSDGSEMHFSPNVLDALEQFFKSDLTSL